MRKPALSALLVVAMLAIGASPATSASTTVRLKDNYFTPKSKTVRKGTRVTFRWAGRRAHNAVVSSGPTKFSSKVQTRGTYRRTLTRRGTYRLVCTLHSGMTLKLRVR